jgi:acetyl-CoA acetyltransferase
LARHPFHEIAIVGIYNTAQARSLPGETSGSLTMEAARGALADAGLSVADVDGVVDRHDLIYNMSLGPAWSGAQMTGISGVLEAASAITTRQCTTVLLAAGSAGVYVDRGATAPWTRPANEFVAEWGLFTAAEFALIARRHMEVFGTQPEHLATVASTIRNNGHLNPEAVYAGRGPFTVDDILASRLVADPFHLLDCSTTSEGGCGIVLTTAERARDLRHPPVFILGGSTERFGDHYRYPPSFNLVGRDNRFHNGYVGRAAARRTFEAAGCRPQDVDVCEFYDPFSFEVIRQFEAFDFCGEGEGGSFVMDGRIDVGGEFPVTTDGGTMSFGHSGGGQLLQRVARATDQLRGGCRSQQVQGARIAMATNHGAGALATDVILLGTDRP